MYAVPDDELMECVRLRAEHGSAAEAARVLGIPVSTLKSRLRMAADRGLDGSIPQPLPPGQRVRGVSTLYDADGSVRAQWVKTAAESRTEDIVSAVQEAFQEYEGRSTLFPAPDKTLPELLALYPLADWHLGLYAWGEETEANWDLDIAERTIGDAMADLIASTPPADTAVILGGGDLFHSDNSENRTMRSGNALDVDGRYQKVVGVGCRLCVHTIDLAKQRHKRVKVRILKGNHDEHTAVAVTYFLLAWYRNDDRVEVDIDPSLFWWFRWGLVLLGATHGHTVKIDAMPSIMAHRRAEDWGVTKFRYVHGFHLHHKRVVATEGAGVVCEIHQAPIPQDAFHWGSGYLSGRSVKSIIYHKEYGETDTTRRAIIDSLEAAA